MNSTTHTRALCGEHGAPLTFRQASAWSPGATFYTCPDGCFLYGSDIQPEPGTHLVTLSGAVFVVEDEPTD